MARSLRPVALILALTAVAALIVAATLGIANSQTANGEYDVDDDGLIDVSNLEQLHAIRYDLDGNGRPDRSEDAEIYGAAFPGPEASRTCRRACNGYELVRPLDFKDAGSYASGIVNTKWTTGIGWLPVGHADDQFRTIFDGNGHTINNLYVRRTSPLTNPGSVGLFGYIGGASIVRKVGLVDVDVTGVRRAGGLVGENGGLIRLSYATGTVSGNFVVGGLVGISWGTISASYATGTITGDSALGGLVGMNYSEISFSYATGTITGNSGLGGLVGVNFARASIIFSYATSRTSDEVTVGGLVGKNDGTVR